MASKPEIIIVPGAWHSPSAFKPTSDLLEKAGYTLHGVNLASYGASPPLKDFAPDVEVIRNTVNNVLSSGKDAIIMYHSYGSIPGSEALAEYLQDLESGTRRKGWGKIQRLVFCTSFVLPEGGSLFEAIGSRDMAWFVVNEDKDEVITANPHQVFYHDVSPSVSDYYIDALKPHSYRTFFSQQTVAPWKKIPSTFIVCEDDQALPLAGQEGMIEMAHQMTPTSFDVIERCNASHSPFISQPEWLAEKIIKAAGGGGS